MSADIFVRGEYDGFPLFRMNRDVVRYWIAGGMLRRQLASVVSKTWKTGVVMLNPSLYAVGTVDPRGVASDLPPPFKGPFEMWRVCNAPSVRYNECACRNYYDPEVGGPWHLRDKERGRDIHHPHCQFERTAVEGWSRDYHSATKRAEAGLNPQTRPDEWNRTRQDLK
ncbi:MAG: hypothetical protein ACPG77_00475 [Nannocystaceae bacterium]